MELVTIRRGYNNNTLSWEEAFYNLNDSIVYRQNVAKMVVETYKVFFFLSMKARCLCFTFRSHGDYCCRVG